MKSSMYIKKRIKVFALLLLAPMQLFAAQITMFAPKIAPANGDPVVVQISLNPEQDEISGISGSFSFPEKLFDVQSIFTDDSVVSLWVKQPSVSFEKNFDGKTHITFEGIFPGGFRGVQSPYYTGYKPGILFTVLLRPKLEGIDSFTLSDLSLHRYDINASEIGVDESMQDITVPHLVTINNVNSIEDKEIKTSSLTATISKDPLVDNGAWYVFVHDEKARSAIDSIAIAETNSFYPPLARDFIWRTALSNPSVLIYQDRTKYVHVKVVYADHTFTITTLPPVENLTNSNNRSRILVSISIVLVLLYLYATHQAQHKKFTKEVSHTS